MYGFGHRSKQQAADALTALGEPFALVGAVGNYLGVCPVERRAAGEHTGERLVRREALLVVLVGALRLLCHRHAPRQRLRRGGVRVFRGQQRLYRDRELALPVLFEGGGELLHRWASCQHVIVGELPRRIDLEILIADVAATNERDRAVGDEELVVHAEVEPPVAEEILDPAQELAVPAITPGIE